MMRQVELHVGILTGNGMINHLRRAHRVHLPQIGYVTVVVRPITASHFCDHASKYWLECEKDSVDVIDIKFHAILLLGLNLGIRKDEVRELRVDHVTFDDGQILSAITEAINHVKFN